MLFELLFEFFPQIQTFFLFLFEDGFGFPLIYSLYSEEKNEI